MKINVNTQRKHCEKNTSNNQGLECDNPNPWGSTRIFRQWDDLLFGII